MKARRQGPRANGHLGVAFSHPWGPGKSPVRPTLLPLKDQSLLPLFLETPLQTLKDGEPAGLLKVSELN